jgi:hypothetical protein
VCDTDIQKNLEAMLYFLALNKGSWKNWKYWLP